MGFCHEPVTNVLATAGFQTKVLGGRLPSCCFPSGGRVSARPEREGRGGVRTVGGHIDSPISIHGRGMAIARG